MLLVVSRTSDNNNEKDETTGDKGMTVGRQESGDRKVSFSLLSQSSNRHDLLDILHDLIEDLTDSHCVCNRSMQMERR